jgi:hypothetical protein
MTLNRQTRTKLSRVLALLGSDKAGERDAAGLAAHRIIAASGMSWAQILNQPERDHRLPELGTWRQTCRACLEQRGSLRQWEVGFLIDLPKFRRLSTKQRYVLKEIADRVLEREAAQ